MRSGTPVLIPPGMAVCVRGERRPYTVLGFEPSALVQPTPQRAGGSDLSSSFSPVFSHTLHERFRYSIRETEIIKLLDESDELFVGHSADEGLRKLTWGGLPASHRADGWRLLLEVAPMKRARRPRELDRKRAEYHEYVSHYFDKGKPIAERCPQEAQIFHQLSLDLPRHKYALFHDERTVLRLERCLFLWSLRHPAVGFVQGMDDLMVQFFYVFVGDCFEKQFVAWLKDRPARELFCPAEADGACPLFTPAARKWTVADPQQLRWTTAFTRNDDALRECLNALEETELDAAEADAYWCGGRMLSWLQDHFVYGQPGLHRSMRQFDHLLQLSAPALHCHLQQEEVQVGQACFQWFHCLLTRELPERLVIRLWDTYLSLGPTFREFHVFVCASLVHDIQKHLLYAPFDVIMMRLKVPMDVNEMSSLTEEWLEGIVAFAYLLSKKHPEALLV